MESETPPKAERFVRREWRLLRQPGFDLALDARGIQSQIGAQFFLGALRDEAVRQAEVPVSAPDGVWPSAVR